MFCMLIFIMMGENPPSTQPGKVPLKEEDDSSSEWGKIRSLGSVNIGVMSF